MILSGRDIEWYIKQNELSISPVQSSQFQQNGIDLKIQDIQDENGNHITKLDRQQFYLGETLEYIKMPNDLMAFVELRSTWARRGLIIPPTIVDAGFHGTLTLEIVSYRKVEVPYGERFAHLIFAKLTNPSEPYQGKYQGQMGVTNAKNDKKEQP